MKIYSNGKMLEVGGGKAQEIYSTEEQVIGRWIDGKPIYRKFVSFTLAAVNVWTVIGSENNYDTITKAYGYIDDSSVDSQCLIPGYGVIVAKRISTNQLLVGAKDTTYAKNNAKMFVEYTKTTDQATIELPATLITSSENLESISFEGGATNV